MKNKVGPPVVGEDFYGRKEEIEYLWDSFENENNIILSSPRRVGKTSLALKLVEKAIENGWDVISINMEEVATESKFIIEFIEQLKKQSIWEKIKDQGNLILRTIKSIKPKLKYEDLEVEVEWKERKKDIYKNLQNLLNHKVKTLIYIDELTVMLNSILKNGGDDGRNNVMDFLDFMRSIRQVENSKIRWIFCSSVGIQNFTVEHRLSFTTNDLLEYKLKPFSKNDSIKMLALLSESNKINLNTDLIELIITKTDYLQPYFLQAFFEKIKYFHKVDGLPIDQNILDPAYASLITGDHFNTWIGRIEEQYGDNAAHTFTILKHICQERKSKRLNLLNTLISFGIEQLDAENRLSKILYMLLNDGYIIEDERLYQFRSPLLRDFWFNRYLK